AVREVAGARQRLRDRGCSGPAVGAHSRARPPHLRPPPRHRRRRHPRARAAGRARLRRPAADLQPRRQRGRAVRERGARGDPLPAPLGLDPGRDVLDPDRGGRDPPDHHRAGLLPRRHGPGSADVLRLSGRRARRPRRGGRTRVPARLDRQSAVRDPRAGRRGARRPGPRRAGTADPEQRAVSQPHQRLVLDRARRRRHPRPHLRARGGGDDVVGHRRLRRGGRPRAARRRLAGHRRPRRRDAGSRRRRVAARRPQRLGAAGLRRRAERRAGAGARRGL
ncbi:MAG: Diaminopimelate epimerase, partial [uncultured Solirubrobacteraceae bacterium]